MKQDWNYRRGDVYLADLGEPIGSEQGGIRPVAVIQNESGCRRSTTMTVVPLTSNLKKLDQPTHYYRDLCGIERAAVVNIKAERRRRKRRNGNETGSANLGKK